MRYLVTTLLLAAFTTTAVAQAKLKPQPGQAEINQDVRKQLQRHHYNKVELNDEFSEKVLDAFIDSLDGTHSIFLASDVARFKKQYAQELDDQIKNSRLEADFDIYNTYQKRRIEIDEWLVQKISEGIEKLDLTNDESFNLDRSEAPWPENEQARQRIWTQQLESQAIDMQLSGMDNAEVKKRLTQRYENELQWLRQIEANDAFGSYMSAYAHSYDPHTDYLSPRQSEELDISLNLELRGIGAELRIENGYAEVVRLIPGGPAAKKGELKPTDQIVAVAQGKKGEFVDVVGMRLDDTVRLIRGEIGSTVRLQTRPNGGGEIETITIVRDKIELKEQAASKRIIPVERDGELIKVGLIRLPTFYNGTARDVKKLLDELKKENVAGVILDLRNNGGGALGEVVKLTGLFMGAVPAVQIRDASGEVHVQGDGQATPAFSGPLAVMVNRLSASASEIFAAAMQDYGRGIIVGSQTFGKGTVQAVTPLSRSKKKGRLTLTQAKFYRISGDSTQRHGVRPDIEYPSFLNAEEIGEQTLPHALPWDQIDPIEYPNSGFIESALPELKSLHNDRIKDEPDFQYLADRIELAKQRSQDKQVSLVLETREQEKEELQQQRLELVNTYREAIGKEAFGTFDEFKESEEKKAEGTDLLPSRRSGEDETDGYQKETANIILDIIQVFDQRG